MITYRTAGDWGPGKGSDLNPAEVDENFHTLDEKINNVIETGGQPPPVSISNIEVIGRSFKIYLTNGTEFGPYQLPIAAFQYKGEVAGGQPLQTMDIITRLGYGVFMVLQDHEVPPVFNPALTEGGEPVYRMLFGADYTGYSWGGFYPGKPGFGIAVDKAMMRHTHLVDVFYPDDFAGSYAWLETPPAADLSFPIFLNATEIGSLDFEEGESVGVFNMTVAGPYQMLGADKDHISIRRPDTIDDDALELNVTLLGSRGVAA